MKHEDVEARELVKIERKQENSWQSAPTEPRTRKQCILHAASDLERLQTLDCQKMGK